MIGAGVENCYAASHAYASVKLVRASSRNIQEDKMNSFRFSKLYPVALAVFSLAGILLAASSEPQSSAASRAGRNCP